MNGLLTLLEGKGRQTRKGLYYKELPEARIYTTSAADLHPDAVPVPFVYEIIDPDAREYRHILQNVISGQAATLTIKTNQDKGWKAQSHVVTMDGELHIIVSVTVDTRSTTPEASGMFARPIGTEYILRLRTVDNPRGIGR